jgi:hypothetical protein
MRNTFITIITGLVFLVLLYGASLQDRMRRKATRAGSSIFSPAFVLRALATKEAAIFSALLVVLFLGILLTGVAIDQYWPLATPPSKSLRP